METSRVSIALDEPLARPAPRSAAPRPAVSTEIVSPELWDRTIAQFDEVCQEQLYTFAKTRWPAPRRWVTSTSSGTWTR